MNSKIVITNMNEIEGKKKIGLDKYEYTKYEVTKRKDFICFYEIAPGKSAFPKLS